MGMGGGVVEGGGVSALGLGLRFESAPINSRLCPEAVKPDDLDEAAAGPGNWIFVGALLPLVRRIPDQELWLS